MDVRWFLKERLDFIRNHYDLSASVFIDRKQRIEKAEPPFDNPPYSEDGEPPFLKEWMDADASLNLVGIASVSLLSDALKLYFNLIQRHEFRFEFGENKKQAFKQGFVLAYRDALGEILDTDWIESGVDFAIIEQVVLARNQGQHASDLTSFHIKINADTIDRHPQPFFVRPEEVEAMSKSGLTLSALLGLSMTIERGALFAAIDEVEKLSDWVERNRERAIPWLNEQREMRRK